MLSQILRIPSGYIDDVDDPAIGQAVAGPLGTTKFAGQLGMEVELTTSMLRVKNQAVPVGPGKFMYVRLAAAASVPAVGATVNWDATVARNLYQVTTAAGTAAGTILTANVTPGNYTVIQTAALPPTGTITLSMVEDESEAREAREPSGGTNRRPPRPSATPASA